LLSSTPKSGVGEVGQEGGGKTTADSPALVDPRGSHGHGLGDRKQHTSELIEQLLLVAPIYLHPPPPWIELTLTFFGAGK
jgi:hypothetical protein